MSEPALSAGQLGHLCLPSRPKVMLVHRSTLVQEYLEQQRDARIGQLVAQQDASVARWMPSHERQVRALDSIVGALQRAPIELAIGHRDHLSGTLEGYDLMIVAGGDGTVLHASHHVLDVPLLGINTDPVTSTGFLCSGSAAELENLLRAAFDGTLGVRALNRLRLSLNGEANTVPILNDLLVTHECPAATSKYILEHEATSEAQQSSGVWICTAAGSTAAMRSAGGTVMSLDDTRIQYRVREPRPDRGYVLTGGFVLPGQPLRLVSKMLKGQIYVDGPYVAYSLAIGDRVEIDDHPHPLRRVFAAEHARG